MTDSIFITLDYLKANTNIQANVDGMTIRPFIVLSMDKYILPCLGTELYNRLITDVKSNSLSGNYLTLMQLYVQPTLAQYTLYEALPFINWQITNKSVLTKNSDNSNAASMEEIVYLQAKILNNASYYAQRFINYMKANYTLFPELVNDPSDCSTIFPERTQYFGGLHIAGLPYEDRNNNNNNCNNFCNNF